MASWKAVLWRNKSSSAFEIAKRERFREWISWGKIYNPKPLWDVIDRFTTWLVSAMTYSWAKDLEEFHKKAVIWVQTPAWFTEWTPHWRLKK
jgi:IMP dehydrogenase